MAERNPAPRRLKEYKAKRNFSKTPEPSGDESKSRASKAASKDRFFCVQKHLASHLHYDFRLEHDGVLLSWAVPKGPSLNPKDKRLAMHVEDHPFDYGEFEGVIPEGYGAGIVMLWDMGTWTPEPGFDDVDKALANGELKFRLNGVKLKGSWVIVRTGGRGGGDGRSWLLIKHRDGAGRRRDQVPAERQELWRLRRHPRAGQARRLGEPPTGRRRRGGGDAPAHHRARGQAQGRPRRREVQDQGREKAGGQNQAAGKARPRQSLTQHRTAVPYTK